MDAEVRIRILNMKAREYVSMHSTLKYDDIVAYSKKEYATPGEQREFVDAVLYADLEISAARYRKRNSF